MLLGFIQLIQLLEGKVNAAKELITEALAIMRRTSSAPVWVGHMSVEFLVSNFDSLRYNTFGLLEFHVHSCLCQSVSVSLLISRALEFTQHRM